MAGGLTTPLAATVCGIAAFMLAERGAFGYRFDGRGRAAFLGLAVGAIVATFGPGVASSIGNDGAVVTVVKVAIVCAIGSALYARLRLRSEFLARAVAVLVALLLFVPALFNEVTSAAVALITPFIGLIAVVWIGTRLIRR